jgi:putative SOS response-associated peptidase YedK
MMPRGAKAATAMCNRFTVLEYDEVEGIVRSIVFQTPFLVQPDWPARRDAFPQNAAPVIVSNAIPYPSRNSNAWTQSLSVANLTWGFDVPWKNGVVFNTRIESALAGGGMWDAAIHEGRCIVPTLGFCETHASEMARNPQTGRMVKQRYRFTAPDGESPVMFLAAVQQAGWFSIVTTQPNAVVSPVHNRMPLVLARDELGLWMEGDCLGLLDRRGIGLHAEPEFPPEIYGNGGNQLRLF